RAECNAPFSDIKVADDKRHVNVKVKDKQGKMEVYQTMDDRGVLAYIMQSAYTNLADDLRFKECTRFLPLPGGQDHTSYQGRQPRSRARLTKPNKNAVVKKKHTVQSRGRVKEGSFSRALT
ncbi:hypothetical protein DPMN_012000, partial [Dreissena polymorpha]